MDSLNSVTDKEPRRILLAEDDELIRELVSTYLVQLGFHVQEAANGESALEIMLATPNQPFDLIVTDMLMPKANGHEIVKKAKDSGVCNRFILMSGNLQEQAGKGDQDDPACAFLEKPFTFSEFGSTLCSVLDLDEIKISPRSLTL